MGFSKKTYRDKFNKLKQLLSQGSAEDIYEISEVIFKNNNNPICFYICIKCIIEELRDKNIEDLLILCRDKRLRDFLRGTFVVFNKKWQEAAAAFRSSLKYGKSNNVYLLYHIILEDNNIDVKLKKSTIETGAKVNIDNLLKIQKMEIQKITYHWPEISSPEEIDIENKTQKVSTIETISTKEHPFPVSDIVAEIKKQMGNKQDDKSKIFPPGTKWDDIKMTIDADFDSVHISVKGKKSIKQKYLDMGFPKAKGKDNPGKLWDCLVNIILIDKHLLSTNLTKHDPKKDTSKAIDPDTQAPVRVNGYGDEAITEMPIPSQIQSILASDVSKVRKKLNKYFGIDDDPFYKKEKYGYHKPKFQAEISDPGDLLNIRNKHRVT